MVSEQCEIDLQIRNYKDWVLCDVMPMDVCHILLGRPWKYDRNVRHDGRRNTYELEKDGVKHKLIPLQAKDEAGSSKTLLLGGREFLQQLGREEVSYAIVYKPIDSVGMELSILPIELQNMLVSKF